MHHKQYVRFFLIFTFLTVPSLYGMQNEIKNLFDTIVTNDCKKSKEDCPEDIKSTIFDYYCADQLRWQQVDAFSVRGCIINDIALSQTHNSMLLATQYPAA